MRLAALWRWVLDAPLYIKIAGVGGAALGVLSVTAVLATQAELALTADAALAREADLVAETLAIRLEEPLLTGSQFDIERALRESCDRLPMVTGADLFDEHGVPVARCDHGGGPGTDTAVVAAAPVLGGARGELRVGVDPRNFEASVAHAGRVTAFALALGVALSLIAMTLLTWRLTRPVLELVGVAREVRDGDLEVTARIHARDELGALAEAFNEMVAALRSGQQEIQRQQAAREALVAQLLRAQEDERGRLARELHDGLGQELSAMLMALRLSGRHEACLGLAGCGLDARLEGAIDEARRMSRALRPAVLDDHGLAGALERLAADTRRATGLPVAWEQIGGASRPPAEVEVVLYRIAQEAVANVARHADASRASLVLIQRREEVRLVVEDDGKGFDVEETLARSERRGIGLYSMRERARLVGGSVEIESIAGLGTTVTVIIPLRDGGLAC